MTVKTSDKNPNTLFAGGYTTNPQGKAPNAQKSVQSIQAFGQNLMVFKDNDGKSYIWAPDGKGGRTQVYLDDPLFSVKENAYKYLSYQIEDVNKDLETQKASHQKSYDYWREKVGIAKENYAQAIPVRDENHRLFNETLQEAGCTYLELKSRNDYESLDLQKKADTYYGLEHNAKRVMWRSESDINTYGWLAFDEQKWMKGLQFIQDTAIKLLG